MVGFILVKRGEQVIMLKKLLKKTYHLFNQVRVVHSIPGRLRLLIPNLSDIPETLRKKYEDRVTELILSKKGIKSIEYSYRTNKVLIYYDIKYISADKILNWLNRISELIIEHSEFYENKSLEEIENDIDILYKILKEGNFDEK